MQNRKIKTICSCILTALCLATTIQARAPFTHRLVFANTGLSKRGIDTCLGRMKAAASLGYNGYVFTNWELDNLEDQNQEFVGYAKQAVAQAKQLKMALIPWHFGQAHGAYSDYNLSEAFPVRGTKFKVAGNEIRAIQDHETGFKNGDFESSTGSKPTAWQLANMPGAVIDKSGAKSGNACLRIAGGGKYARIKQNVTLKPFRAYRLSAWISTKGFTHWADARFVVHGSGPLLHKRYRPFGTPHDAAHNGVWTNLSINHGWRFCQTDFNSLRSTSASIEFMVSDPRREQVGTIWLDDVRLEEVGLYETVRRRACPIVVKSLDGTKIYKEGTDYAVDPKCNTFTDQSWWYQGHLTIPQGSAIVEGQELRVDWYQMTDVEAIIPETNFCLSETREALKDNLQRIDNILENDNWMSAGFDEWRVAFWDDQCELFPKAKTAGEYMAGALRMSLDLLWQSNPRRTVFMWNDMFDPYHNAWKPYAMTNGGCLESWKDMDTNLVIINWNACGQHWRKMSLRFYMGVDDSLNPEGKVWRQVLSVGDGGQATGFLSQMAEVEKEGGRGVVGVQFVNWGIDYSQMGAVAAACRARGLWGTDTLPIGDSVSVSIKDDRPLAPNNPATRLRVVRQSGPGVAIEFSMNSTAQAILKITDLFGRAHRTIDLGKRDIGNHETVWNTTGIPAGIYFLTLSQDGKATKQVRHVIL